MALSRQFILGQQFKVHSFSLQYITLPDNCDQNKQDEPLWVGTLDERKLDE